MLRGHMPEEPKLTQPEMDNPNDAVVNPPEEKPVDPFTVPVEPVSQLDKPLTVDDKAPLVVEETKAVLDVDASTVKPLQPEPATPESIYDGDSVEEFNSFGSEVEPPTISTTPSTVSPIVGTKIISSSKKSKKKYFIIGGVAAAFLVLFGGGALTYAWYQNPQKVVLDSMLSLVKASSNKINGTLTFTTSDFDIKAKVTSNSVSTKSDTSVSLTFVSKSSGSTTINPMSLDADLVVVNDEAIYFKLDNLDDVARQYVNVQVGSMSETSSLNGTKMTAAEIAKVKQETLKEIMPLVTKLNNRWIKISYDDFDSASGSRKDSQKCVAELQKKIGSDAAMRNELSNLYRKNTFIVINDSLGVKNGSVGYTIGIDGAKATSFARSLKGTKIADELKKCDSTYANIDLLGGVNLDGLSSYNNIQIWADQWSHDMTGMKANTPIGGGSSAMKFDADVQMDLNSNPKVVVPTNATSFKDIEAELGVLWGGSSTTSTTSSTSTSSTSSPSASSSTAHANARAVLKVAEAYAAEEDNGRYPTTVQLQAYNGMTHVPSNITLTSAKLTSSAGDGSTIQYIPKGTTGGCIGYWDTSIAGVVYVYAGNATTGANATTPVCS